MKYGAYNGIFLNKVDKYYWEIELKLFSNIF